MLLNKCLVLTRLFVSAVCQKVLLFYFNFLITFFFVQRTFALNKSVK